ncbi:hypothetical protein BT96DRAFT_479296 [Gymnopus androsaceus JB14]|uniref:Uncharacterized protein n=1 Tax=Gymnopus androsaceus JB14 TaxID=1447944 RepID=A0A6A4I0P9_9AGAR|nr:hypothetical protein BT96DRAFT_479296 [Gymnopus androsaceus JB14]
MSAPCSEQDLLGESEMTDIGCSCREPRFVRLVNVASPRSLYVLPCIYNDVNMKTTVYGLYLSDSGWVRSIARELNLVETKDALAYLTILYNAADCDPKFGSFVSKAATVIARNTIASTKIRRPQRGQWCWW